MKISVFTAVGALATLVAPASAFPFMSGADTKTLNEMIAKFKSFSPANIAALGDQIKAGIDQVKNEMGDANIPKASSDFLNTNWKNMNQDKIYQAFNLGRSEASNLTERTDIFGFGLGEDADHPWQAPGPGDMRGPCPGLNTIANHGYLPRNGVVNPVELFIGTWRGLHLSPDLCAILAIVAFLFKGDMTTLTLSIGGKVGLGDGLSGHGALEGDASVTRKDAYFGNQWSVVPSRVEKLKSLMRQYGNGDITPMVLSQSRYWAWDDSRKTNPNFDFNPWRMLVAYGESGFVMEVLRGNNIKFTEDMIDAWFLQERFPQGWQPRIIPMTTPEILAWAAIFEILKPTLPGWSLGIKGLFIPLPTFGSLSNFFGGMFNGGNSVQAIGCSVGGSFLGWFPSTLGNLFGGLNLGEVGALSC